MISLYFLTKKYLKISLEFIMPVWLWLWYEYDCYES